MNMKRKNLKTSLAIVQKNFKPKFLYWVLWLITISDCHWKNTEKKFYNTCIDTWESKKKEFTQFLKLSLKNFWKTWNLTTASSKIKHSRKTYSACLCVFWIRFHWSSSESRDHPSLYHCKSFFRDWKESDHPTSFSLSLTSWLCSVTKAPNFLLLRASKKSSMKLKNNYSMMEKKLQTGFPWSYLTKLD